MPDEWKEEAIRQIAVFRRLAEMPIVRMVGEEGDGEDPPNPPA